MDKEYIRVGQIINTHGIKGELKIYPLTDNKKRFKKLKTVYVGDKKQDLHIEGVKEVKDCVVLKFQEFDNINQVLNYKREYIYIEKDDTVNLPKDHYFIFDLVGCSVQDQDRNYIGRVKDVLTYSSNDVYVIYNSEEDREYMIPALKKFVKDIDIENKMITVEPIEGMIE